MLKKKMKQIVTGVIVSAGLLVGGLVSQGKADVTPSTALTLVDDWNLKGATVAIDVAQTLAAKKDDGSAKYASVWTWDANVKNWRVFLPGGGTADYASDKGFAQLDIVAPGDGFWVNVNSGQGGEVTLPQYIVKYLPGSGMSAPKQGKTAFQISIAKASDNSPVTGLTPTLAFTMHMENGMNHSTPADLVTEASTPGLYDCTAYYLMASGSGMGTWDMEVNAGGETSLFHPDVAMAMGNTTLAKLKGVDDKILAGTATANRTYMLFNDGLMDAGMGKYTLKLFIATQESMMNMPAIAIGSTLKDDQGASWQIATMQVEASTDQTNWVSGTETAAGHWSIPGIEGLTQGQEGTIYVRLTVNGEVKTSDGAATGTAYAPFKVTPATM